jgi:F0F1-type ATP synthase assembly protein I
VPDAPIAPDAPPKRAVWFRYTDASSVGIEMVISIVVCALGALWLERNVTHWSPWTSLIGIGLGLGAATKAVFRAAKSYRRQLAESAAQQDPPIPEPPIERQTDRSPPV